MLKNYLLLVFLALFTANLQAQADIIITEVSYNPPESGTDSLEYVEIYNNQATAVSLDGYSFTSGFVFTFPNITLQPNAFLVIAEDSLAMFNAFGYVGAYEFTSGSLLNGGEAIALTDNNGLLVDSLSYDDIAPWPTAGAGNGSSIVFCDLSLDNTDGANWFASTFSTGITINSNVLFGSPGALDSACICNTVSVIDTASCATYTTPSGDETYTVSGNYTDTILNAAGCDSIITINLTINNDVPSVTSEVLCGTGLSYTVPSGDETYTVSGQYFDTIPTTSGCDSLMTINVTFGVETTGSITATVCDSYTVPSGTATYLISGVYNDTLPNALGCDSVITINLTVADSSNSTINEIACNSYIVPSGDETYTTSGVYKDTLQNAVGCDSIITINLTINNSTTAIVTEQFCGTGLSYIAPSGATYTTTGQYFDTIPNTIGCDSIITLNLTFGDETTSTITEAVCLSYTVPSGDETYTVSGQYTDTLVNSVGCDSVITIDLTILTRTFSSLTEVACDSYTTPSGNQTYTVSGVYNDTLVNANGCDSIISIALTVNTASSSSISATVCDSYSVPTGGEFTTTGIYSFIIPNAVGCDSLVTLDLTVNNSTSSTITELFCGTGFSYTVPSGTETYTTTGQYFDTLTTVDGCDSTFIINLTFSDQTTSSISEVACYEYTVPSGDSTYTTSGVYFDTITNVIGCDSVIEITLTINDSTFSTINEIVCDSYTVPSGNNTYTTSGTYTDVIPNAVGCDSLITINLTILTSTLAAVIDTTVCYTYTSPSGNDTYTSSGTYSDILPNAVGCDSIFTINLTVLGSDFTTIDVTVCDEYTVPSGDSTYAVSGTYSDTLLNILGCDSIITINLTVNNSTAITFNENICGTSYTVPSGDETYTTSGQYTDTLVNGVGCDLVITINLNLFAPAATTITEVACDSFVSGTGMVYAATGTYTETLTTVNGCDSVVTIDLTIVTVDTSVTVVDAITLSANATGTEISYQWLNCNDNFTEVSGATDQVFVANANGSYAVEVTNGNCVDTSACFTISSVSVEESDLNQIEIFPNPSTGIVNISFDNQNSIVVNVYNVNGQLVYATDKLSNTNHTFRLDSAPGLYFVEITNDMEQKQQFKLILE